MTKCYWGIVSKNSDCYWVTFLEYPSSTVFGKTIDVAIENAKRIMQTLVECQLYITGDIQIAYSEKKIKASEKYAEIVKECTETSLIAIEVEV